MSALAGSIRACLLVPLLLCSAAARSAEPVDATLAQLIAKPQAYQGKVVRVAGYLHLEFEGNGLYPNKADSEHYRTAKGVWLDPAGPRAHD